MDWYPVVLLTTCGVMILCVFVTAGLEIARVLHQAGAL